MRVEPRSLRIREVGFDEATIVEPVDVRNPRDPAAALIIAPGEGRGKGENGLSETRVLGPVFPTESGDSTTLPASLPDAPAFAFRALGDRVPEGLKAEFENGVSFTHTGRSA